MKISFYTFGCTVNSYETQKLKDIFTARGDEAVEELDSDAVVINSCAITGLAEKNVQRLIANLRKRNPDRIIAVVGCFGEMLLQNGRTDYPDVDILLGNDKFGVCDKIHSLCRGGKTARPEVCGQGALRPPRTPFTGFVQLQSGCDNRCSYCIVPLLRGRSVSRPVAEIRAELEDLAARGYREIVLAGLNLGLYNDGGCRLSDVCQLAEQVEGIERVRLSSLEPMDVNSDFIEKFSGFSKLVSHLHISLQSGSDRILKLMNRNYRFEDYLSMITKIREKAPGIAITTDIIVGFPGESEKDFLESVKNIVSCGFSDIHIFKYSARKGTVAAEMRDQVTEHQKSGRAGLLKGVKMQARYAYNSGFLHKTEPAAFVSRIDDFHWEGVTKHNISVVVRDDGRVSGGGANVKITGIDADHERLTGEIAAK